MPKSLESEGGITNIMLEELESVVSFNAHCVYVMGSSPGFGMIFPRHERIHYYYVKQSDILPTHELILRKSRDTTMDLQFI